MKNLLIVDDDPSICDVLSKFLKKNGYHTDIAYSGKQAFQYLKKTFYDLVLCDYKLGDIYGKEILEKTKELYPDTIIIFISGYGSIQTAVNLVREGAYTFLTKPLYPDIILTTIEEAFSSKKTVSHPGTDEIQAQSPNYIIGESKAAQALYKNINLVGPTDYSVIIYGETGTGKEAVARLLHAKSPRKDGPFVAIDCGILSKELAASELFGHLKGSFTGAIQDKKGAFEMADGGTIFLDEIGNLAYEVQVLLLRTIQEKMIRCIGEVKEKRIDVRVLVASNENLYTKVQQKQFREDLYHRLDEFMLEVPSLQERKDDIPLFVEEFIIQATHLLHKNIRGLTGEVRDLFNAYHWPGNIRELQNVIKRACLLTAANHYIDKNSLPLEITGNSRSKLSRIE